MLSPPHSAHACLLQLQAEASLEQVDDLLNMAFDDDCIKKLLSEPHAGMAPAVGGRQTDSCAHAPLSAKICIASVHHQSYITALGASSGALWKRHMAFVWPIANCCQLACCLALQSLAVHECRTATFLGALRRAGQTCTDQAPLVWSVHRLAPRTTVLPQVRPCDHKSLTSDHSAAHHLQYHVGMLQSWHVNAGCAAAPSPDMLDATDLHFPMEETSVLEWAPDLTCLPPVLVLLYRQFASPVHILQVNACMHPASCRRLAEALVCAPTAWGTEASAVAVLHLCRTMSGFGDLDLHLLEGGLAEVETTSEMAPPDCATVTHSLMPASGSTTRALKRAKSETGTVSNQVGSITITPGLPGQL